MALHTRAILQLLERQDIPAPRFTGLDLSIKSRLWKRRIPLMEEMILRTAIEDFVHPQEHFPALAETLGTMHEIVRDKFGWPDVEGDETYHARFSNEFISCLQFL